MRKRFLPVLLLFLAIAVMTLYFYNRDNISGADKWISLLLVVSFSLAVLRLIAGTNEWNFRNLGLLATLIGVIALFGRFFVNLWDLPDPGKWLDALYRGAFVIGAPLLLFYSLRWFFWARPKWLRD